MPLPPVRHRRKLKTGALEGNRFRLVLRDLSVAASDLGPRERKENVAGICWTGHCHSVCLALARIARMVFLLLLLLELVWRRPEKYCPLFWAR